MKFKKKKKGDWTIEGDPVGFILKWTVIGMVARYVYNLSRK